ncbi:MAG: hypothetical protein HKN25_06645 [Pyrinomonadaceae bacterium]|nr:hypothetical protein [Pyrinomonadaceae bacterium]
MAKIIMQGPKGHQWRDINVCNSVGKGGFNARADVMVVQALMHYALPRLPYFHSTAFPMPNGNADEQFVRNIVKFQRYLRKNNRRVSVDGRIDPAKGMQAGRRKNLYWTIQQLNSLASDKWILLNNMNVEDQDGFIDELRRLYPQVDAILAGTAVGSLSLALA